MEEDELLSVGLSNAVGAGISTASATGSILNDDIGMQRFMPLIQR